jgi:gliding motility-associated-like protein
MKNMMKIRTGWVFAGLLAFSAVTFGGASSQSLGGLSLIEIAPRVITPNGDQLNDVVYFRFDDTLSGLPIEADVFDINGAEMAAMTLNSTETALTWDGKDGNGRVVPSGIYIYSIKLGNHQATGTVVVAR